MAILLVGSWRNSVAIFPTDELTAQHIEILWPLAVRSGSVGLLGRLTQGPASNDCAASFEAIKQCYRQQVLDCARYDRAAERVISTIRAAGIQPVTFKGWAIAREYPGRGLRSYTDIDIAVRPNEHSRARAVLSHFPDLPCDIDLHAGVPHMKGRDPREIDRRRQRAMLGSVEVDVLGHEDHLRLLCIHMLISGAWRTIWLVDIALMLEKFGATLDFDYLLTGDRRDTEGVLHAFGLAHHLLGAELPSAVAHARDNVPQWLIDAILEQWGRGYKPHLMLDSIPTNPMELIKAAKERWPNPIASTALLRAPWTGVPRLPIQMADYLLRTAKLIQKSAINRFARRF